MTPASHTLYTLTLFLALTALKLWSDRRHRSLEAASPTRTATTKQSRDR
jgi:hypothetical protein